MKTITLINKKGYTRTVRCSGLEIALTLNADAVTAFIDNKKHTSDTLHREEFNENNKRYYKMTTYETIILMTVNNFSSEPDENIDGSTIQRISMFTVSEVLGQIFAKPFNEVMGDILAQQEKNK